MGASWGSIEKRHLHRVLLYAICIYYSTDFPIVNMHVRTRPCLRARGGTEHWSGTCTRWGTAFQDAIGQQVPRRGNWTY